MSGIQTSLFFSERISIRILRHLVLFFSMILIFTLISYTRNSDDLTLFQTALDVLVNSIFFFGYAYLTAYLFLPIMLRRERYVLFTLIFLITGILISSLKFIFSDLLFYTAISSDIESAGPSYIFSQILVNTKDMTFIVALFVIAKYARDNHKVRQRLENLREAQIRTEIRLLQNQLDPHVIFNNLNNLYCLGLKQSEELPVHLERFESLLQYYFSEGGRQEVPLEKEVKAIRDYIHLEKLRYGNRLQAECKVMGNLEVQKIYPFVLFPYVENCIKYGCSAETGDAWINIGITVMGNEILFHASNSKPENIQQLAKVTEGSLCKAGKLELLYPRKHALEITNEPDSYSVDLSLMN